MSPRKRAALAFFLGLALAAGALAALADPPRTGSPPDPPAQASRKQWMFEVAAQGGNVTVGSAKATTLEKPAESPRVMGRFALELYVGPQILDRVRFNLPLMDAPRPEGDNKQLRRPSFDQVSTKVHVRMADNPRASYLLLVDRATGDAQRFDWPPEADGRLVPWKTGRLADAGPGDLPGNKLTEVKDGGPPAPKPGDDLPDPIGPTRNTLGAPATGGAVASAGASASVMGDECRATGPRNGNGRPKAAVLPMGPVPAYFLLLQSPVSEL